MALLKSKKKRKLYKKYMPQTLLGRSLLIVITPIILIQALSTFLFFDRHWSKMTTRLAYAVAGEVTWISDQIEKNPSPKRIGQLTNDASKYLSMVIDYEPGKDIPEDAGNTQEKWMGWEALIGETLIREMDKVIGRPYTIDVDFDEKWVEVRVKLKGGLLSVSLPQRRLYSSSSYIFLLWVYSISLVLLIIAVLFMRNQIRPIRRLAIAAERFGKGRDVADFKIEGAREVRQAAQAFLDMRTRIQRQISQRTEMLAGVSHDLRTPLTRLRLQLAMLGDTPDTEAMKSDIKDMENMIDGYLNFVRGEGRENTQVTDLGDLLNEVVFSAKRQGCDVHLEMEARIPKIVLRPSAIKRCLSNIISNANKYAQTIWVTLREDDDNMHVEIIIEDDGPGIPEDQFEAVFRPFYRVDTSRNMETGGVGLGLPIAMDIVHAHGGKIWLSKSKHGGLAVHMNLPK